MIARNSAHLFFNPFFRGISMNLFESLSGICRAAYWHWWVQDLLSLLRLSKSVLIFHFHF